MTSTDTGGQACDFAILRQRAERTLRGFHGATSYLLISEIFLIATPLDQAWTYRIDYPYYSRAETVVRPQVRRKDFTSVVARLNELEQNANGSWKIDTSEPASAVEFADASGKLTSSGLQPDVVAEELRLALGRT